MQIKGGYMNKVAKFYDTYDEESRLTTNNARKVECIVTTSMLNKL